MQYLVKNLRNKNRDLICEKLNKKGIETRPIISGDFSSQKIIKNHYNYLSKFKLQNSKIINDSGFMIGISSIKLNKKIVIKLSQDLKTVISSVKKRNS